MITRLPLAAVLVFLALGIGVVAATTGASRDTAVGVLVARGAAGGAAWELRLHRGQAGLCLSLVQGRNRTTNCGYGVRGDGDPRARHLVGASVGYDARSRTTFVYGLVAARVGAVRVRSTAGTIPANVLIAAPADIARGVAFFILVFRGTQVEVPAVSAVDVAGRVLETRRFGLS